jgi:integrase
LQFLHEVKELDLEASAGSQVTPNRIERYIERVRLGWSSVTLAQSIYKLCRMAGIVSPATDFTWLADIAKDLALVAYPKDRFDRIVTTERLIEAGLTLVKEAQIATRRRPLWRAGQMRDGVMIAMLAYHPIRLKNLSQLELGKSFLREDDRWLIVLGRKETKAKRPDTRAVEDLLQRAIALYLTWARPRLMRGPDDPTIGTDATDRSSTADSCFSGPLWIGQYGEQLSYSSIDKRIRETTLATLGVALSAHDFRRCAAVTVRFHAGSEPHLASGLLQHIHPQLVDENYNLASSMAAALRFGDMIADLHQDALEPAVLSACQIPCATSPKDPDLFSSTDSDEQSKAARI